MLKEFRKFILRGNVVDLAVAVVIGAAFGAIVTSFVKDMATPLIAAIGGKPDFSNLTFTIHHSKFLYGDFINSIISFLIIATIIFFFVVEPINRLMTRLNPSEDKEPKERECPHCKSSVPIDATKCKFCTSSIKPTA